MSVTYSVCIGGAGIDYSRVTSILYTYSAFSITLRFLNQLVGATLAQLLGYACPGVSYASAISLSPIRHAFAVGDSIPFWDSSTLFCLLSRYTCSSTSYVLYYEPALFAHFRLHWGSPAVTPYCWPTLTFSSCAVPLLGF